MLSLNQIVKKLNLIQVNHAQLNSFHFGDPWELEASENLQYPVLVCALLPGSLSLRQQTLRLYLAVADLVTRGEENETEVLSDTQLILLDVYAQLWEYLEENNTTLERDATLSPFTEKWDNTVSGFQAEVNVTQFYSRDACQVPLRGIDTDITSTIQLTTSLGDVAAIYLDSGEESDLFRIVAIGAVPTSGNITVTVDIGLEFWDGTQWLDSNDTITIPFIGGGIVTDLIYKIKMLPPGSGGLNFALSAPGLQNYSLLVSIP